MPQYNSPLNNPFETLLKMPVIFDCFSLYLFKLGRAPQIQDLYGKIKFTGIFLHIRVNLTLRMTLFFHYIDIHFLAFADLASVVSDQVIKD